MTVITDQTCRGSLVYHRLFTMQSFQRKKEKGFLKKSWRVKGSLFQNCKQSWWLSRLLSSAGSTVNEL